MRTLKNVLIKAIQRILTRITSNQRLGERYFRITHHFEINRICNVRQQKVVLNISSELELWRALTYESKEPETLKWIEEHFAPNDVFYDIGANIGVYSLYARARLGPSCRIYAFEPDSQNYGQLNKNIFLNGFSNEIQALPVAISDQTRLDQLNIRAFSTGSARHAIGEQLSEGRPVKRVHVQPIICFALDHLVSEYQLPFPNHIKIDVDGHEFSVLKGTTQVLRDDRLRTLLIEVESHEYNKLLDYLGPLGFVPTHRTQSKSTSNGIFVRG